MQPLINDERYEVLDGELVVTPAPDSIHQKALRYMVFLLWRFVKEKNLGDVLRAPLEVVLANDVVVQPDIVFIIDNPVLQERGVFGTPGLIIEIVSPSYSFRDKFRKRDCHLENISLFYVPPARDLLNQADNGSL